MFRLPDINIPDEPVLEQVYRQVETIVRAHHQNAAMRCKSPEILCETSPFSVTSLTFHGASVEPVPTTMLSAINRISRIGLPIAHVNLQMLESTQLDAPVFHEFLETQVASPRETGGLSKLSLGTGFFDVAGVEAFSLAIARSNLLRQVECGTSCWYEDGADEEDFERWLWMVYALFSVEASHEIHKVGMNMEILDDVSCVDAMRAVLSHEDPLAFLHQSQWPDRPATDVTSTAAAAVLIPSAVIREGRHGDAGPVIETMILAGDTYRVVWNRPHEDFIEILLPRRGVCWTYRSQVLEMRPVARRPVHPVRDLRLTHVENDSVLPTAAMIELIGGPVEHLTIEDLEAVGDESTRFFDSICAHCPNLKRLDLKRCNVESLHFLSGLPKTLKVLWIGEVHADEDENLDSLLTALSDPNHSLAVSLRELYIDFQFVTEEAKDACLAMLDLNHRLQVCAMVNFVRVVDDAWASRFLAHHGEPLQGREGPLPQAETVAFLSTVTRERSVSMPKKKLKTTVEDAPARNRLDIDALRLILDLAALPLRRTCSAA